jgi:ribose 5-phosphate isomerase B
VALGADHAGFDSKQKLAEYLKRSGHEVVDLGTHDTQSCDYPDPAHRVGRAVVGGQADRGVLVCGSGIGMSIAANKLKGVRAALVMDDYAAEMCRRHNDANVICLAGRVTAQAALERFLEKFLATPFEGGRHQARVDKIEPEKDSCGDKATF